MKVLELYEPVFQYVCQLNRLARHGASPSLTAVRERLKELLNHLEINAKKDRDLRRVVERLKPPMVFFFDERIATSPLSFAEQWHGNRLAQEMMNILTGDEDFHTVVMQTMAERGEEADAMLCVLHMCYALGFTGRGKSPEDIRDLCDQIQQRVPELRGQDMEGARFTEEAGRALEEDLPPPETSPLLVIVGGLIVLILSGLLIYYAVYMTASDELLTAITYLNQLVSGKN